MRSENRTVTHRKNRLPIRPSAEERTWSVCTARSTASIKCPTVSKQNVSGTAAKRYECHHPLSVPKAHPQVYLKPVYVKGRYTVPIFL